MPIVPIDDPGDPRLAPYANLKDRQLAALAAGHTGLTGAPGLFMAEGELVVRALLASPIVAHSILLTPTRLATVRDAIEALPEAVPVYLVPQGVMDSVVGFHIHRGILAAAHRPEPPAIDRLLARARSLVVLECLSNHDNVGGIFRAAAGLMGLDAAILLSPGCCDPLYRKSIRVSLGAALRLPFATLSPWPAALADLRAAGFTTIALTPATDALDIRTLRPITPPARLALLLGAEGPGLTPQAQASADLRVRIPIDPGVDSLNVVTAAAIAMDRLTFRGDPPGS